MTTFSKSWPSLLIGVITTLLLMSGTFLLYVAIWLLAKPDSSLPFYLLSPLHLPLLLTCCLAGLYLLLLSLLGLWTSIKQTRVATGLWMLLLLLMLISESVLTVLFLLHQQSAVLHIKEDVTRKLKNHFGIDEELSQAINYVQNKFDCCGVMSPLDYRDSVWRSQASLSLPLTCCSLLNSQAADGWEVPQPENIYDCQAGGGQNTRHTTGCLSQLLEHLQHFSARALIFLITIVVLKVIGILTSFSLCKRIDRREFYERIS